MKNTEFLKCIFTFCMAAGALFFSLPVTAGGTYWSINIGMPVVAAPPPVVVYSNPLVPVTATVSPAPVIMHPYVVPQPVVVHHPAPHWYGPRYYGKHYRRHKHR